METGKREKRPGSDIDFQAEFVAILKQHGIECDPRYEWG
jgi:hypothetical protein